MQNSRITKINNNKIIDYFIKNNLPFLIIDDSINKDEIFDLLFKEKGLSNTIIMEDFDFSRGFNYIIENIQKEQKIFIKNCIDFEYFIENFKSYLGELLSFDLSNKTKIKRFDSNGYGILINAKLLPKLESIHNVEVMMSQSRACGFSFIIIDLEEKMCPNSLTFEKLRANCGSNLLNLKVNKS